MKSREEQLRDFDAMPFPVGSDGMLTSKCAAILDENGAVVEIVIRAPYTHYDSPDWVKVHS